MGFSLTIKEIITSTESQVNKLSKWRKGISPDLENTAYELISLTLKK